MSRAEDPRALNPTYDKLMNIPVPKPLLPYYSEYVIPSRSQDQEAFEPVALQTLI